VSQTLSGIRVLEVASWTFVPAAGAILADWGAESSRSSIRSAEILNEG
jgi:crotonobetainyl-CoA:carnitine CoA-transferase CaiB-like acyl-CoA transferase